MKNRQNRLKEFKELLILIIIALTIKTCLIEIYVVPTGSMEKTILIGDMLIGNKFIYGMRTPNWIGIPYTRFGVYIPSFRLPKFKEVINGDVVIFEFPRDPFQKYVKRCIGIPEDKIEFIYGNIYINGSQYNLPSEGQFTRKFGNYDPYFLKQNHFPESADTITRYMENQTWFSHTLYPDFRPERYHDINKNAEFNLAIDVFDLDKHDLNENGIWDFGNSDNINEFVVPYKGMPLDFNNVKNWESLLTLLLLDGYSLTLDDFTIDQHEIIQGFSNDNNYAFNHISLDELAIGYKYKINNNFGVAFESHFKEKIKYPEGLMILNEPPPSYKSIHNGIYKIFNNPKIDSWNTINLSSGYSYKSILFEESTIKDISFSLGLGILFNNQKNNIDFSFTIGSRGSIIETIDKENYYKLNIAIISGDKWFRKRRRD